MVAVFTSPSILTRFLTIQHPTHKDVNCQGALCTIVKHSFCSRFKMVNTKDSLHHCYNSQRLNEENSRETTRNYILARSNYLESSTYRVYIYMIKRTDPHTLISTYIINILEKISFLKHHRGCHSSIRSLRQDTIISHWC